DHVLDCVRDELTAGERVEHARVTHRDAVVDRDGVELAAHSPSLGDRAGDELAHVLEMDVAGYELREAVRDCDDGLAEVVIGHAGGSPQGARTRHGPAVGGGT